MCSGKSISCIHISSSSFPEPCHISHTIFIYVYLTSNSLKPAFAGLPEFIWRNYFRQVKIYVFCITDYLHAESYHPNATKKAIMKGETKRYLRTNSNKHNFNQMKVHLVHKLKHRGYKQKAILNQIKDIKFTEHPQTLQKKKVTTKKLMFSTQFCDDIHQIKRIINKHWKPVQQNPRLKLIFPDKTIIDNGPQP